MAQLAFITCTFLLLTQLTQAQIPAQIAYQGVLTDSKGNPLPNAAYLLEFNIYDDSALAGTSLLWTEPQTVNTKGGQFSVALGSVTSLKELTFDKQYWLGVKRDNAELLPRLKLLSTVYARRAALSDSSLKADVATYAKSSGSAPIPADSVDSTKVRDGSLSGSDISSGAKLNVGTITTKGRIGIGTDTSLAKVTILGDIVLNATGKSSATFFNFSGNYAGILTDPIVLGTNDLTARPIAINYLQNTPGIVIQKNGNIGIGTTRPNARLDLGKGYGVSGEKFLMYNDDTSGSLAGTKCGFYMDRFGRSNNLCLVYPTYSDSVNPGSFMIVTKNTSDTNLLPQFTVLGQSGNVGIGTTNPLAKLDVVSSPSNESWNRVIARDSLQAAAFVGVYNINGNYGSVVGSHSGNLGAWADLWINGHSNGNGEVGGGTSNNVIIAGKVGIGKTGPSVALDVAGCIKAEFATYTGSSCTSDRRYKTDITPIDSSLAKITSLQGVYYNWDRKNWPNKNFPDTKQIGLIAQDVEKVVPEVVNTDKEGYKSLSYDKLAAVLIEAVKELKKTNEMQQEHIAALEKEMELLKNTPKK